MMRIEWDEKKVYFFFELVLLYTQTETTDFTKQYLFETPTVVQLVKNLPPQFFSVFTKKVHYTLYQTRRIQSVPLTPFAFRTIGVASLTYAHASQAKISS